MDEGERPTIDQLVVAEGDADLDALLSARLTDYNYSASGVTDQLEFTVKVEDDGGQLVAGLSGWTWGTCAGIAMVWVREDNRQSGWGARMLEAAEQVVRERGCEQITVSSLTFQAPGFYGRHGYVETGRTEGLPLDGMADVHFVKWLVPTGK
ncbi:MAG: GNAT family N-acetyltransferase [Marmoricola sp.]